jgi:hypothetical protein
LEKLYIRIVAYFTYKDSCFKTNKAVHFRLLLEEEGFNVEYQHKRNTDKYEKEQEEMTMKEIIDLYIVASFDPNDLKVKEFNDKYLELDNEDIIKYERIFIDKFYATNHFNIVKYYITGQQIRNFELVDNFIADLQQKDNMYDNDKTDDINLQFHFLNMLLMETQFKIDNKSKKFKVKKIEYTGNKISLRKELTQDRINNFYNKYYKYIHNDRKSNKINFKNENEILKLINILHKKLFGKEIIIGKQNRIKGSDKYTTEYYFNYNYLYEHFKIYDIGKGKSKEEKKQIGYMEKKYLFVEEEDYDSE